MKANRHLFDYFVDDVLPTGFIAVSPTHAYDLSLPFSSLTPHTHTHKHNKKKKEKGMSEGGDRIE